MGFTKKEILTDLANKLRQPLSLVFGTETVPNTLCSAITNRLINIQTSVKNELVKSQPNTEEHQMYSYILGYLLYHKGKLLYHKKNYDTAKKSLMECLQLLDSWKLQPECVIVCLDSLNMISNIHLLPIRQNLDMSLAFFEQAEDLHWQFRKSGLVALPCNALVSTEDEIIVKSDIGKLLMDRCDTVLMANSHQIFELSTADQKKCDAMFKRLWHQLEFDDIDYCSWTLLACTMSLHLSLKQRFAESRHFLAGGQYMLDKYKEQEFSKPSKNIEKQALNIFRETTAHLDKHWATYGQLLFPIHIENIKWTMKSKLTFI